MYFRLFTLPEKFFGGKFFLETQCSYKLRRRTAAVAYSPNPSLHRHLYRPSKMLRAAETELPKLGRDISTLCHRESHTRRDLNAA